MTKPSKNETAIVELINKVQEQLTALDKKIDSLVSRSLPLPKPAPLSIPKIPQHDHHQGRQMYQAICADCKKECSIPFKPSGDRPVYCQDCFSRRKVISMSGIKLVEKPNDAVSLQVPAKKVTKVSKTPKKPIPKKKPTAKKK